MTDHDLISMLHDPSFVDPILSLMVSFLVLHLILLLFQLFKSLISCSWVAVHSCHCVLSLCWLKGLVHDHMITEDQGYLQATGNSTTFFQGLARSTVIQGSRCGTLKSSRWHHSFQPFHCTGKPVPMHPWGPTFNGSWATLTFLLQETNSVDSPSYRSTVQW